MNKESHEFDVFENMPINKAVRTLAIPTVISQLIMMIYNLADTYFLGQTQDTRQVAAVTLSFPIFMIVGAVSNLFGIGSGSLVSRLLGQKKVEEASRVSTFALWAGAITSILIGIGIAFILPSLLEILGADDGTYQYAVDYILYTVIIGGFPSVLNQILANLTRSKGDAKTASIGVCMGAVINIILDPILILMFHMDVAGAAIATCVSNAIAAVYYVIYFYKTRNYSVVKTNIFSKLPKNRSIIQIFSIGTPAALTILLAAISNSLMMNMMSGTSAAAIAGFGIAQKVEMIPFYIIQGISSGVLPLLAYTYASKNYKRMDLTIKTALKTGVAIALICFVMIELFAPFVVNGFITDLDTIAYGSDFTRLRCLCLPFITIEFMFISVFQGLGSARQAFVLSFIRKGILDIPILVVMNLLWPLYGLMLVEPIMECVGAVIAVSMYKGKHKELISF